MLNKAYIHTIHSEQPNETETERDRDRKRECERERIWKNNIRFPTHINF